MEGPEGARGMKVRDLLADAYTPNLAEGELITPHCRAAASLAGIGAFVAFKRAAPVLSNRQLCLAGGVRRRPYR